MWQYALWGFAGAGFNRALIFLEANRRAKGAAWRYPEGPGGGYFLLACVLHCVIGAGVTFAAAASGVIATPLLALGLGTVAPIAMAKIGRMALDTLPPGKDENEQVDSGKSITSERDQVEGKGMTKGKEEGEKNENK